MTTILTRTDLQVLMADPRPPGPGESPIPILGCPAHMQDGCNVVYRAPGTLDLYCHTCYTLLANVVVGDFRDVRAVTPA